MKKKKRKKKRNVLLKKKKKKKKKLVRVQFLDLACEKKKRNNVSSL